MQIPACNAKANSPVGSSVRAEIAQPADSLQYFTLSASVIERRLFWVSSVFALFVITSHQQLFDSSDALSLWVRLAFWAGLTAYGLHQLRVQSPITLSYSPKDQFRDLDRRAYDVELIWSLMPGLMLIRYRCLGLRWRYRMIWPDSGHSESLRLLRVSLTAMR